MTRMRTRYVGGVKGEENVFSPVPKKIRFRAEEVGQDHVRLLRKSAINALGM